MLVRFSIILVAIVVEAAAAAAATHACMDVPAVMLAFTAKDGQLVLGTHPVPGLWRNPSELARPLDVAL